MIKTLPAFLVAFALALAMSPSLASAACTSLSSTGGPTIDLQRYLYSAGYLTATPNGVYGPATTAAVKKFQAANSITQTGTIGPITRLAIQIKSCGAATVATPTQTTSAIQTPSPSTPTATPIVALSPTSGQILTIGSTVNLRWNGPTNTIYNVILEDASSTSVGFVVSRISGTSFDWTVGDINANNLQITSAPGTYRVRVQDAMQGAQSSDRPSAIFTIAAEPISIQSVMPQSGKADDKTAVAVYGSGFKQSTSIDFYGYGRINPTYISSDGKVLVFTVPSRTYPGMHSFAAINSYVGSDTLSRSGESMFTVTP